MGALENVVVHFSWLRVMATILGVHGFDSVIASAGVGAHILMMLESVTTSWTPRHTKSRTT